MVPSSLVLLYYNHGYVANPYSIIFQWVFICITAEALLLSEPRQIHTVANVSPNPFASKCNVLPWTASFCGHHFSHLPATELGMQDRCCRMDSGVWLTSRIRRLEAPGHHHRSRLVRLRPSTYLTAAHPSLMSSWWFHSVPVLCQLYRFLVSDWILPFRRFPVSGVQHPRNDDCVNATTTTSFRIRRLVRNGIRIASLSHLIGSMNNANGTQVNKFIPVSASSIPLEKTPSTCENLAVSSR